MNFDSGRIRTHQSLFSHVYDHSLPDNGWPPVTWKGSGDHVPLSVQANGVRVPCRSQSQAARAPARGLLPDYASDPLAGTAGRRVPSFLQYFYFYFFIKFIENRIH
ncbi:unnamed protein product [Spirodela intermedia]|uniref:Uncharacterized protein n=1 Tax=Spirodela intermedia TaxID=51605 RepID=A0A7I8JTZ1_SPIIN|nr:unnamed protein product [Spirodela intermedia]CAA6673650.1 unnamed protein product [Spirodela intermedia]